MLTTIEGTYENGQIVLKETPKDIEKAEVFVVFKEKSEGKKYTRQSLGFAE